VGGESYWHAVVKYHNCIQNVMHEHIQDAKHGKLKTPIDKLGNNEDKHMVRGWKPSLCMK